ncbi:unnamed protein product [Pieris macdunnoughi]|uniref:Uncharacterized protein n=1 Tax=Pieris macdunnoughi TaxID=345717 RepID=A0A821MRW5_9NEOP|nr:unnamed protein product [Pieris macdunnoughi]
MANPKCRFIFLCEPAIQKTTLRSNEPLIWKGTEERGNRSATGGARIQRRLLASGNHRPPPASDGPPHWLHTYPSRTTRTPKRRPFTTAAPIRYDRKCLSYFKRAVWCRRFLGRFQQMF